MARLLNTLDHFSGKQNSSNNNTWTSIILDRSNRSLCFPFLPPAEGSCNLKQGLKFSKTIGSFPVFSDLNLTLLLSGQDYDPCLIDDKTTGTIETRLLNYSNI